MLGNLRSVRRQVARVSRELGRTGYLVTFAVPTLTTLVPALVANRREWWAVLGPIAGIFLTALRSFRIREIRARLASLEKAGDTVANELENGLYDLREAARGRAIVLTDQGREGLRTVLGIDIEQV